MPSWRRDSCSDVDMTGILGSIRDHPGDGARPADRAAYAGARWLDLLAGGDRRGDALDRLVDRHAVVLAPVAVTERDRAGLHVLVAGNHHERDLLQLRVAD